MDPFCKRRNPINDIRWWYLCWHRVRNDQICLGGKPLSILSTLLIMTVVDKLDMMFSGHLGLLRKGESQQHDQ